MIPEAKLVFTITLICTAAFNTERRAREVSLSEGILTLDLTEDFVAWQGVPLYLDDDRHLNQTGHAFVAQLLANRLSE